MAKFRVKELAEARGITQERLAQASEQSISTIIRLWRNKGASEPRASTLIKIADVLGVSIKELYTTSAQSDADASPPARSEGNKQGALIHAVS